MSYSTLDAALAAEHLRDLTRDVERARLVKLARCCRPAAWRAAAATAAGWFASVRRTQSRAAVCATC
jgi:hypothetical protein